MFRTLVYVTLLTTSQAARAKYETTAGGHLTAGALGVAWVLSPQGGDCQAACGQNGQTCDASAMRGLMGDQTRSALAAAGANCRSFNSWDYGQGPSQCTNSRCCWGNCVGACSVPTSQAGCSASNSDYSRLCACRSSSFLECAKANDRNQRRVSPAWPYYGSVGGVLAPNAGRQSVTAGWEPVLEAQPGCNGQSSGQRHFSFLVALDAGWIQYYNEQNNHFTTQGYRSLEESARLLFDHVTHLYEQQFGIRISISRTIALPELQSACRTNNGYADGVGNTNTRNALEARGISRRNNEAGILRLGVGLSDRYCHSYAGVGALCSDQTIVNQVQPFSRDTGRMNFRATTTLAHEIGHYFGICTESADCTSGHTRNDIPDIMVWNGEQEARVVRPVEGMFKKFMVTCTTQYEEQLCRRAREARCTA